MKKQILSMVMVTAMLTAVLAGCSGGGAKAEAPTPEKPLTLKIGVSTGDSDPRNIAARQFADEIAEKSGGAVLATVNGGGVLGSDADLIDAVALKSGKVDIVISDASNFASYEPKMGISALPFLFDDFDTAWAFMDSEIETAAEDGLLKNNFRVLTHYCNGFRCVTNSKGPINSPEDMKGLVIRTPENPIIMATMTALGANPQPLGFSELYAALRQGTYDAQENPVPVIYNNKLYEVQEYLSITNHIYSGMCFVISDAVWQCLSEEQQRIVQNAAVASSKTDREMNRQQTQDLLTNLVDEGMKINEPDLEPFAEKTASVLESNRSTYGGLMNDLKDWLEKH
ncbi:MAG: TRAP transporter substrate-binding protein [Lachnospiraceae bacterium]|nr:TRAP transporter substrate-binding protein [Lachnospiraceae bacterium]